MDNLITPDAKLPLILFSGGLDSSYLLQEKLKEGDVEVLYVKGVLHENKMEAEQRSRNRIIKILEKSTGHKVRKTHVIDLGPMPFGNIVDNAFTQPPMWMLGALMVSDFTKHTELLIGYVSGDQIGPVLGNIQVAWEQLQAICKMSGQIGISFPLRFTTKQEILSAIHPEVVRNIWYCEIPRRLHYSLGEEKPYPNLGSPNEEIEAWHTWRDNRPSAIRSCGQCGACVTFAAQLFIWNKREREPYWKRIRRGLHSLKQDKMNQELSEAFRKESEVRQVGSIEIVDYSDPLNPKVPDPFYCPEKISIHGTHSSSDSST